LGEFGNSQFRLDKTYQSFVAFIPDPGTDDSNDVTFQVKDDQVKVISFGPELSRYAFQLHQILTDYGQPDQILVRPQVETWNSNEYLALPVFLFYPGQRFLAEFYFVQVEATAQACLAYGPRVFTWSPDVRFTEEWIQSRIDPLSLLPLKVLTEVSPLGDLEFYQEFQTSSAKPCFEILEAALPQN
jgi:hypothetical protein